MNRRDGITRIILTATPFISMRTSTKTNLQQRVVKNDKTLKLGILLFDKVEELDFVGPLQVFSVANDAAAAPVFEVFTLSFHEKKITAVNNLQVIADYNVSERPQLDILLIPGGIGRKVIMKDPIILAWLNNQYKTLDLLLSVCTGAFVLGHAGLLTRKNATTNMQCYREFREAFPETTLKENVRYVRDGNIITSGGISAGIDMSLFVVGELLGKSVAKKTASLMEYDYDAR